VFASDYYQHALDGADMLCNAPRLDMIIGAVKVRRRGQEEGGGGRLLRGEAFEGGGF
jgi:hypothetical protein